ncbi:hypothetical protein ACFYXS_02955 [Streptomyces sp. NPDC002574]|uniref:hypothetical protein n=1 Tax=Streptomyces sp. NPDC002574 TaxID=3364652 RepID=UPI0036B4D06E
MPETGHSWSLEFEATAAQAPSVRQWVALRLTHPDAPQVANELFLSVLSAGSPVVAMTLSTAGARTLITAAGSVVLTLLDSYGPGVTIVSGFANLYGVNADGCGVWAQLISEDQ